MKIELRSTSATRDPLVARAFSSVRLRRKRSLGIAGAVLFVIGALQLPVAFFSGRFKYTILKTWPSVDATATQSEVITNRYRGNLSYGTKVEFKYFVNGKEYQAAATSSYQSSSYEEMKRQAAAFAPGTRHPLLYDPADPTDIRFDGGYTLNFFRGPAVLAGMGLLFSAAGGLIWFRSRSL